MSPTLSPHVRPCTEDELARWLHYHLDVRLPRRPVLPDSAAPFQYLSHAFFGPAPGAPRDCVVWAPRGGGKTFLGAVATALDLIYKPGVEVAILAGSREQAGRMYEHLRALFDRPSLRALVRAAPTERSLELRNASRCRLLAASHASVRGLRVQILRCDEVELFSEELWEAAQLTTRTADCAGRETPGAIEAFSTMHRAAGLMSRIIDGAGDTRTVFRWGVVDVLARCSPDRPCEPCDLQDECDGRAKEGAGHIRIDDALTLKSRVAADTWESEMLCLRPSRSDLVFPDFNPRVHVASGAFDPNDPAIHWCAAMDFGFRSPTVVLIAARLPSGHLHIQSERSARESLLAEHIEDLLSAPRLSFVAIDPAGRQRSEQTGLSNAAVLRRAGFRVRDRRCGLQEGLAAVRARLRPASGSPSLSIEPECRVLIESMNSYRYPPDDPLCEQPLKDGADHACDALRYLVVSLDRAYRCSSARYA